ncbi:MAG: dephospho-CoA kinase [Egibacteraceae bacterium]
MHLVGLTGGIASGKSTVAAVFSQHGMELVDADLIAREVVVPGAPAWHKIITHFGDDVVGTDGFLDRRLLGELVFADPAKRRLVNELTHPPIMARIASDLEALAERAALVVLDMALLVEIGMARDYDAIVVVSCRPETQLRRLVEQRGMSLEQARQRVEAQAPLEERLAVATHVIENEGSVEELRARAGELAEELRGLAR